MSSRGTNPFDIAIGQVRYGAGRIGGYAGQASRWSDRHLWGGAKTLWIGLGLLLVILLAWALTPSQTGRVGRFGPPSPVGVVRVQSGDINVTLNALGTVTPLATVTVRPQVSGNILKFDFQEGQMVKAGDLLAEIDPRPFQAALDQAKGQLAKDTASLENARLDLRRFQALYAQNAIAQQQRDTQAALVRQDEGVVKTDEASVESAAINLGFTKITSPVAGRAGIRQVDIGNLVQAGQTTAIVVVTEIHPISVLFSLPEDNIGSIMERVNSGAILQVAAYDRAQTTQLAAGTLAAVDSQIDTTTGTVRMRAMFDNSDGALFPNQFVNVRLLVNTLHDQAIVPSAAIQRGAEGGFVWTVGSDNTVSMRTVTTGVTENDRVAIASGLKPGETVVVDGADRLRDGQDVTLQKGEHGTSVAAAPGSPAAGSDAARAARRAKMAAAMKQYCSDDLAKFCPNIKPGTPEMRQCFFQNMQSFSDTCRNALAKLRSGRRHFGGGGGSGGGFGGGGPQ
jgi:multidrug efflux system membrane fusion protein